MTSKNQTSTPYLMGTACAGLFTFGVMTSFLGATLPELSARSGFDLARSGTLFSFLYLPQVPMVFLAGPLDRPLRQEAGDGCRISVQCCGAGGNGLYTQLRGARHAVGDAGPGKLLRHGRRQHAHPRPLPHESLLRAQFGKHLLRRGGVLLPLLVAVLTRSLGLVATMWFVALLVGLVALVALAQKFPPASMAGGFDWGQAKSVAINPAVIILACVLFFYSALEVSTAGWIRTFLEKDLAASPESSKIILTAFWIMMMLGRLIASQVVKRVRGPQLVLGCSMGAIVGLLLMVLAPNVLLATAGIILCGLCLRAGISHHRGNRQHVFFAHLWNRFRHAYDFRPAERGGGSSRHRLCRPTPIGTSRHLDSGGYRGSAAHHAGRLQQLRAAEIAPPGTGTGMTL